MDEDVLEGFTKQRATLKEFSDVMSKHPPSQLPPDRGWPLPREQCEVIDAVFAEKAKSGMVRESKSLHSTSTFYVPNPNGKWREFTLTTS
ncbi:Pol protein [Phytophthora palmivora]|uniref:Pol protein n=1 Tax=Phytophthora palmivora TaxID=4796 RepID=A0A2P4X340_9STRA|nr:Pol protein [Phytophthora palmivora]